MGRQWDAGAAQYSAYPPPGVRAQIASPIFHWVTFPALAAIFPATSSPRTGEAPGGGRINSGALHYIGPVHAGIGNFDQHLPGFDFR